MDAVVMALAALGVLGMMDELFGNRLGLGVAFFRGFSAIGRLALSMTGFYCIGLSFVRGHIAQIAALDAVLPFDPSLLPACVLCCDTGGLPIAMELAASPALGIYTGALISGGLGAAINFQMPCFLSSLEKEEFPVLMRGLVYGFITLPLGLCAGGVLLSLPLGTWLANTFPVLIFCGLLIAAFSIASEKTLAVLIRFGFALRLLMYGLFALVIVGLFAPRFALTETGLVQEAAVLALRTAVISGGGMAASELAIRYMSRPLDAAARLLQINRAAVIGLILSCFQSVAMLPLFPEMDRRGKIMNAAFAVCGAFFLGGQMAFVAQLIPKEAMTAYIANKLLCGISAIALAGLLEKPSLKRPSKAGL